MCVSISAEERAKKNQKSIVSKNIVRSFKAHFPIKTLISSQDRMEYARKLKTQKVGIVQTIFDFFIFHLEAGSQELPFEEGIAEMLLQIAGTPACIRLFSAIEEYMLEQRFANRLRIRED